MADIRIGLEGADPAIVAIITKAWGPKFNLKEVAAKAYPAFYCDA